MCSCVLEKAWLWRCSKGIFCCLYELSKIPYSPSSDDELVAFKCFVVGKNMIMEDTRFIHAYLLEKSY